MKRKELLGSINLIEELIPKSRLNRPGSKISVTKLTIHNTDKTSAGADANAHSSFVRKTGYYMHKGNNQVVANDRAARLASLILHDNTLDIDNMVTHKSWTGKDCSSLLIESTKWTAFKKSVNAYLNSLGSASKPKGLAAAKKSPAAFQFKACWCGEAGEDKN